MRKYQPYLSYLLLSVQTPTTAEQRARTRAAAPALLWRTLLGAGQGLLPRLSAQTQTLCVLSSHADRGGGNESGKDWGTQHIPVKKFTHTRAISHRFR